MPDGKQQPFAFSSSRFRRGAILVAGACLLLLGAGCRHQRDPQTVVMLIEFGPASLDPRVGTDAQSERIGELIFDSLLRRDEHSNLQPWLAERWETLDPLTYRFHLRSGVRFHDGRPLTARDVRYTFESLLSGEVNSPKAASFARIASVESPDDSTVVIRLKEPYASFLWNLTQGAIGIVPEGAGPDFARAPIGSGPFQFVSFVQDEAVRLRRNPAYWASPPRVAAVEFRIVPDATTRALELRKGSADVALNSLPADTVAVLQKEAHLRVLQAPGNTYQYLGLNLENRQLSRPVRQAIAYAINREDLIRHLWRGLVRPANSILPPQHWAHEANLPSYGYDPLKALALLEAAGLAADHRGVRLRLEMKTSTDQTGRELAAVLQEQLSRVGIQLTIRSYEFATFFADIIKGNFDLYSLRWTGANEDPDIFEFCFASDKVPPNGANRGRYSNPAVDEMIAAARKSTDLPTRRALYAEIQRILNQDLPYIHLWHLDNVAVYNRRLTNLHLFPSGNYDFLTEVELSAGGSAEPGS
ncbi:MAG TPA: ABC transporter substrate-binding protein [Terriglobia bacterium]|nr:ABC transporter substrate-binding protein [Terriglobia bacterium]